MWVVRGPFDGDEGQDLSTEKSKLLKPGKVYVLGRKDTDLQIPSKKISREHVKFALSEFPTARVDDPTFKPKARLQNPRNKPITIQRGTDLIALNPSSSTELWDGDAIHVVGGITVVISWYPLCCRTAATFAVDKESCASIGIHVVHSSCPEVTHTIVQELALTPSCVLSLLNSKVVTPMWLAEVIHRGIAANPSSALEQHFELPHTPSYLPTVSTALPSTLSSTDVWITGTSRRGILDDYRFIIFTCNSECVEDFQSVISVFGGGYELFPVDSGRTRLHRRLSADKGKRKVIAVDDEVKASVSPDTWNELIDEAKSFELTFSSREQILETILVGNTSALQYPAPRVHEVSSQPRQGYSSQGRVEGSSGPKRLTRRTTPSTRPSLDREHSSDVEPPQIRRVLTRRVKAGSMPPEADHLGTLEGGRHVREDPVLPIGIDIPPLPRPSRPLKRRGGTAAPDSVLQSIDELGTPNVEPPLKKFKALFEESDPDRLAQTLPSESLDFMQESHSQPPSMPSQEGHALTVNVDEVSQRHVVLDSRGTKRRACSEDAEDGVGSQTFAEQGDSVRPLKRRLVERASRSTTDAHPQPSQTHGGANFGEPDTDKHFLTALASMKKGKKNEDSFDREFNNLRISKPDVEREVKEQEWDLLDGLDDEHGVRGNFMLVVELDVYKKDGSVGKETLRTGRIDWEGKPNFKKFRRKNNPCRRPAIELVMNQGNDYGVGPAYWKDDPDLTQADEFLGHSQASSKARALQLPIENSDDEDQIPVKPLAKTSTRTTKGKTQGPGQEEIFEPLFLNSEDEQATEVTKREGDDRDEGTETLRSAGSPRKPRVQRGQPKRVVVVVDDDDSDDGTTFKGFGTKPKPGRR